MRGELEAWLWVVLGLLVPQERLHMVERHAALEQALRHGVAQHMRVDALRDAGARWRSPCYGPASAPLRAHNIRGSFGPILRERMITFLAEFRLAVQVDAAFE